MTAADDDVIRLWSTAGKKVGGAGAWAAECVLEGLGARIFLGKASRWTSIGHTRFWAFTVAIQVCSMGTKGGRVGCLFVDEARGLLLASANKCVYAYEAEDPTPLARCGATAALVC